VVTAQTVRLAMLVRDEEANLERCLNSAAKITNLPPILVDTGSTDDTIALARSLGATVHRRKWRGFGPCRSELMRLAKGTADYLLLADADMEFRYDGTLPQLTADAYHGRILGSIDYALPMLVRGDLDWRYQGVVHSYLDCPVATTDEVLPGLEVVDHGHTTEAKLRNDLELLTADLIRNPGSARSCFYLAQTYFDLDLVDEAIQFYRLRAEMDGWDEETFYARYRLGVLLCEHRSFAEGARELLRAWEQRPSRIEPLRALANVANNVANKFPHPGDRLFVHRDAYTAQPEPGRAEPVIASLASMSEREASLERTVASLLPQVDRLRVYLNGYEHVPGFLDDPKIDVARSQDHGDRGDAGKLHWLAERFPGFRLSCDDDLVYPPDYAATMVAAVERYSRRALVGLHGRLYKPGGEQEAGFYCLDDLAEDQPVNFLGTGVMAYHTSVLSVNGDGPARNMADQWVAARAQSDAIPCVVVAHRGDWLQHTEHERTMWDESQAETGSPLDMSRERAEFLRSLDWKLHEPPPA
jgi:hypothetical protein